MDAATQTMIRNIEEKTGHPIQYWLEMVRAAGDRKHGELVTMLKSEHGFGHGYANLVVHMARGALSTTAESGDQVADALFAGKKAGLQPVYEALRNEIMSLGSDVEISPKKTYVSFRRKKQFVLAQPSTATRLDVGLSLKGVPPGERLEPSAGFSAMCTHRVRIESAAEIDRELLGWIRQAYDAAG